MKRPMPLLLLTAAAAAQAHEGHGLPGAHWHATDVAGFVIGAVAVAALLWWRGKK
jgi:hypothetical protein